MPFPWLRELLGILEIQDDGSAKPTRSIVNFRGSAFTIEDDPANDRTNITMQPSVSLHDLTDTPQAIYQFNETLNDTSGNARHLSITAGNERYVEVFPGIKALNVTTTTRAQYATTGTPLQRSGDITLMWCMILYSYANGVFWTYDGNSEAEANNTLYEVSINTEQLLWFSESGAGVNASFGNARLPPLGIPCHIAYRRSANIIQGFLNGAAFGAASSALATPTGGTTSFLRLGHAAVNACACAMWSAQIVLSALSDAAIKADYNKTLGGFLGRVS